MSVVSYLDCGCAILSDGGREWCPTCAAKIEGTYQQPQPLDDKEFSENLLKIVNLTKWMNRREGWTDEGVDQIRALLQPKIEEARREAKHWKELLHAVMCEEMAEGLTDETEQRAIEALKE